MLVSGVAAGIAAGLAFGGDWRRLGSLSLRWWPVLVVAVSVRLWTAVFPNAGLSLYVLGIAGVGFVAAANWRVPGATLIAIGTFANLAVITLNAGMPYDANTVVNVGASIPADSLHVPIGPDTHLPFLSDIIPFGVGRAVYSIGDLVIAFGGFLIPFVLLQDHSETNREDIRSANFAFFWLAQVVSRFGDPITLVALTFITYRATQSALLTAIAVGVASIPNALFGFFGGAIADAAGPRRAMFWCDVVRAIAICAVPVLLMFDAPLAIIFVLVFVAGICGAIFAPARGAVIAALLRRQHLAQGNSLVFASDRAVEISGALAGGALVATVGEGAFYVDALTFALSAILLARVVVSEQPKLITWSKVLADARDGMSFLRRSAVLWSNTLFSLVAQFSNPVINTLTPAFLIRRFAANDALAGAVLYAGSEAAIAVGAVFGSALLPRYLVRVPKGGALLVGFALSGLVIVLIAFAPSYAAAAVLFGVLGFTNVLSYVPTVTILQEATPQPMVGRVFGARIAMTNLSWLPIILLGGLIADRVGVANFLAAAGLVTLGAGVFGWLAPAIRSVR